MRKCAPNTFVPTSPGFADSQGLNFPPCLRADEIVHSFFVREEDGISGVVYQYLRFQLQASVLILLPLQSEHFDCLLSCLLIDMEKRRNSGVEVLRGRIGERDFDDSGLVKSELYYFMTQLRTELWE